MKRNTDEAVQLLVLFRKVQYEVMHNERRVVVVRQAIEYNVEITLSQISIWLYSRAAHRPHYVRKLIRTNKTL